MTDGKATSRNVEGTIEMTGELVQVRDYVPSFAIGLGEAQRRLEQFQEFIGGQMLEGEDYGTIPGTAKPTLFKPGAEKLANIFGFAARFEEVRTIEDWEKGMFYFAYKCFLKNKRTGAIEAECVASCNSKEDKYRWRLQDRTCPGCGEGTIRKGSNEFGGGWYCNRKQGGCGAKFKDGDEKIESQKGGKVENPDPFSLVNTFQKMAQKRALVGAVLIATRASGIFTQDLEDLTEEAVETKQARGKARASSTATQTTKGKLADDDSTQFWAAVDDLGYDRAAASDLLKRCKGDFKIALTELRVECEIPF